MQIKLPAHDGPLIITHNPHKGTIYTVAEYVMTDSSKSSEWISKKSYEKSMQTNELWRVQISASSSNLQFETYYGDNLKDVLQYLNKKFTKDDKKAATVNLFHNEKPKVKPNVGRGKYAN